METNIHDNRANVDAFIEAKKRVAAAIKAKGADTVSSSDLGILLRGRAPDPDLPHTFVDFDASFVPFLSQMPRSEIFTRDGITVTPHPDGGVVLASTNGRLMLLARDPSGRVSDGGCRLLMPDGAVAACQRPKPFSYADQGDTYESNVPEWAMPGRVISLGASLLVTPKVQPPEIEEKRPDDGVMLWASGIETGNVWCTSDARRLQPVIWWEACKKLKADQEPGPTIMLSAPMMKLLGQAASALLETAYWQVANLKTALVLRPREGFEGENYFRDDVMIIAMKCNQSPVPTWPDWLADEYPDKMVVAPVEADDA